MDGAPTVLTVDDGRWGELIRRAGRLAVPGARRLLGIAGAPGAGKSTVAAAVVGELGAAAALVPMDGFHLAEGELHRLFSVLKMRFSNFDRALHVYTIDDSRGIRIAGPAPRAEGLLTGMARPLTSLSSRPDGWPAAGGQVD